MSTHTTSTATNPGHPPGSNTSTFTHQFAPDPLLRGGAYIHPCGETRPPAPGPSSSGNGAAEMETPPPQPRRSAPRPPDPGSEIASWLPEGWLVEERWRTSGATAGTVDKYYFDPKTGRRFRSKKEVQYFLETGTVRQKKRGAEISDNSSDISVSQKKKSGAKIPSVFDPSNVPEAVVWSLTNAMEDIWTPSIHGNEVAKQEVEGWKLEFTSRTAKSSSQNGFSKGI